MISRLNTWVTETELSFLILQVLVIRQRILQILFSFLPRIVLELF